MAINSTGMDRGEGVGGDGGWTGGRGGEEEEGWKGRGLCYREGSIARTAVY